MNCSSNKAFKRYCKEPPLSKSYFNDGIYDNEISGVINNMNYKYIDSDINNLSKKFMSIDSCNNSIHTDNDDNNTIVTANSYDSHNSNNGRDSSRYKAIQMMKNRNYREALNLLDDIIKADDYYIGKILLSLILYYH